MERVQKLFSLGSYCSRREAEKLIEAGRVKVNNEIIKLGHKANINDKFEVDNIVIKLNFAKKYYLLNKPKGYICSNKDKENKRVVDLIKDNGYLFTVGRLDVNTTGLIIITNDGEFSQMLEKPGSGISKTYIVKVNKIISSKMKEKLEEGVKLENGYTTMPLQFIEVMRKDKKKNESVVKMVLQEGKKNQIKEMFKVIGVEVINLTRIKIGNLKLHDAKLGEYRKITPFEVEEMKKIYKKNMQKNNLNLNK